MLVPGAFFSSSEQKAIVIARTVSSIAGLIGSFTIVAMFAKTKLSQRLARHYILMGMSLAEICGNIGATMSLWIYANTPMCSLQGFLIHQWIAAALWTSALAIDMILRLIFLWKDGRTRKLLPYYAFFFYGFSVATGLAILGMGHYGDALLWCWIAKPYPMERIGFFYGPLWAVCIFLTVAIIVILVYLTRVWGRNTVSGDRSVANLSVSLQLTSYLLAFVILWIPSSVARIQQMLAPSNPSFALVFAQALFLPLQGLINLLVYIGPSVIRRVVNEHKTRTKTRSTSTEPKPSRLATSVGSAVMVVAAARGSEHVTDTHLLKTDAHGHTSHLKVTSLDEFVGAGLANLPVVGDNLLDEEGSSNSQSGDEERGEDDSSEGSHVHVLSSLAVNVVHGITHIGIHGLEVHDGSRERT